MSLVPETTTGRTTPRSVWRPYASGLCALSLMALVVTPAVLQTPQAAPTVPVAQAPAGAEPAPTGVGQNVPGDTSGPQQRSTPIALGTPSQQGGVSAFATSTDDESEATSSLTSDNTDQTDSGTPDTGLDTTTGNGDSGSDNGSDSNSGNDSGGSQDSPLLTLAQAIPPPPDAPVPDVPEQAQPIADALAPATITVCSTLGLPGGLANVGVGLAGGSVPGLKEFVGALLLYQVPILDLCSLFGYPSETVECDVDDQIRDQIPGAVPVQLPAPMGTTLGIGRGAEGAVAGDTSTSDQFLAQAGCEARPS